MSRPNKVRWATKDRPREAIGNGSIGFANDQIYSRAGDGPIFTDRKTEIERWLRESGTHAQGVVYLMHKGSWVLPTRNDPEDPMSVALVIETLMRLNWDCYIISDEIVPFLERWYPQLSWDNYIVGRILGSLHTGCQRGNMRVPEGADAHMVRVQSRGINKYAMRPDMQTWEWLRAMRNALSPIVARRIEWLAGNPEKRRRSTDPRMDTWDTILQIGYAGRTEPE